MLAIFWYFLELVLFKYILELFGQNWLIYFGIAAVLTVIIALFRGLGDEAQD